MPIGYILRLISVEVSRIHNESEVTVVTMYCLQVSDQTVSNRLVHCFYKILTVIYYFY